MSGKKLVVDTCVARSAGDKSQAPESKHSRDALTAIREHCQHELVFNPTLSSEWKTHAGRFALSFLTYMVQRRRVHYLRGEEFSSVVRSCSLVLENGTEREAFDKDAHVVAAALASDQIILSNEVRLWAQLAKMSPYSNAVGNLVWANPSLEGPSCVNWLKEGAPWRSDRKLSEAAIPP